MKLSILVVLVITFNVAFGMSFRPKRQSPGRWRFVNQGNPWPQFPEQTRPQTRPVQPSQPQISTPRPSQITTTTLSPAVQLCIRNCPVTAEYNPVCGTDMVKYNNIGRLECAKYCGVNVNLLRAAPCPTRP